MLTVVLIAAVWTAPSQWLYGLGLRERLRAGEKIGITPTPPAPGAILAGRVLGFNYMQPPLWFELLTRAVAASVALAPAILLSLHLRRRISHGRRAAPPRAAGSPILRAAAALIAAGAAFSTLEHLSGGTLWRVCLGIGEAIGGQVIRLGGFGLSSSDGPFVGGGVADHIGNLLVRHGPYATLVAAAIAAAHFADWALWRGDLNHAPGGRLCPTCGYDLRGLSAGAICPECGQSLPPTDQR